MSNSLNIAFLHPDLGIGGAERLVVDSALALKARGHKVTIYTSRHDPKRSFKETHNGELDVRVAGSFFPRAIFNRLMVICAIIRNLFCALSIICSRVPYDVVFIDQISGSIPLFKWFAPSTKVLFYCHFPDKHLTSRDSALKRLYRRPIDWFEEYTTSFADKTVVNSNFTARTFTEAFPSIAKTPAVLYPCLNLKQYDETPASKDGLLIPDDKKIILSINRYERKKNLGLAMEALGMLKRSMDKSGNEFQDIHLVFAGGYDPGLRENVEHLEELKERSIALGVEDKVSFVCSFNEEQRSWLLRNSYFLVYTPSNEHFGITPLEGMYMGLPVVAVNSGGPLETVKTKETGYLCDPTPEEFSKAFQKLITDTTTTKKMAQVGRKWVESQFSFEHFANQLDTIVRSM
eukprot:gene4321-5047_t